MKVALVTGAAAGIGRACCEQLARAGIAVGVLDLDRDACARVVADIVSAGGRAVSLLADIVQRDQVIAAVAELRKAFGPVTILVNNAGITDFVRFQDITDEDWNRMLSVNLTGTFITTQVVLPDMEAQGWGRVINIGSSSVLSGTAEMTHYTASKGGVMGLTRSLALELGPLGITVNTIAPGSILNTVMSEDRLERLGISREDMIRRLPVQRAGNPDDIANAVFWLAAEESGYVTGQTIAVNGGRAVT
ncbi:MAG: SDR family NAD(P)-dependent oxidoreductase [Gammaproteobacteria bacterium]